MTVKKVLDLSNINNNTGQNLTTEVAPGENLTVGEGENMTAVQAT